MPEPPDFDQIARRLIEAVIQPPAWTEPVNRPAAIHQGERYVEAIVEQLSQVWNARGAADLKAYDAAVVDTHSVTLMGSRELIERAIRSLDR